MTLLLILVAIAIGMVMPMQPGMNARLAIHSGSEWFGLWVNMAVGFVLGTVLAVVMMKVRAEPWPGMGQLGGAPWWVWLGGVLGTLIVGSSIMLIPRMGASLMIAALMSGHVIGAMVIDHFGMVGVTVERLSPMRIFAGVLMLAGVVLFAMSRPPPLPPSM